MRFRAAVVVVAMLAIWQPVPAAAEASASGAGANQTGVLLIGDGSVTWISPVQLEAATGRIFCSEVVEPATGGLEIRMSVDTCPGACIPEYDFIFVRLLDGGPNADSFGALVELNVERPVTGEGCSAGTIEMHPAVGDFVVERTG